MRQDKTRYRDCHTQKSLHVPQRTISLRTILDRASAGLPINAKVSQHIPLPDDGENLDDFATGTEEYIDLVDVQNLDERIKAEKAKQAAKQAEAKKKAEEEALQKAIEDEISRRAAASQE